MVIFQVVMLSFFGEGKGIGLLMEVRFWWGGARKKVLVLFLFLSSKYRDVDRMIHDQKNEIWEVIMEYMICDRSSLTPNLRRGLTIWPHSSWDELEFLIMYIYIAIYVYRCLSWIFV